MENKELSKPQADLPLPRLAEASAKRAEKEISEHATPASQGEALRSYGKTSVFKSKFFLGFVILSVLIAFLIGGLALGKNASKKAITPTPTVNQTTTPTPTPNPTSDWNVYVNRNFKYSLKLPHNYNALDAEFNNMKDSVSDFSVSFLKYSSEEAKSFKDSREKAYYDSFTILSQAGECTLTKPAGTQKESAVTVGGTEGTKWIGNSPTFGDPFYADIIIHINKNNRCYQIYSLRDPNNLQGSENLFDQILSTFTFTPLSTSKFTDTSTWKTYTYKNMSFKYPQDWVVVFDDDVSGQPNGFGLHIQGKDAQGYQPDELILSTLDDGSKFRYSSDRTFTKNNVGSDEIKFAVNDIIIYSKCAFYSQSQETFDACNGMLSTLSITQ